MFGLFGARKHPFRQPAYRVLQLHGQVAIGKEAIAGLTGIEAVLTGPRSKHHLRVAQEIAIDRDGNALDGKWFGFQPSGVGMVDHCSHDALAKAQDVSHYPCTFSCKCAGWQPDRAQKIGLAAQHLPQACILLIQGIVTRHESQYTTGLEHIEGLCQKKVMQGEAATGIHEFEVCEGDIADDSVNAVLRQTRIAEVFNADVMSGMQCACDTPGEAVELYTDEPHPRRGERYEIADAATGFQHGGILGYTKACERVVHGADDERRGVEGGKGGALGAGIVLRRQEGLEFFPKLLPARIGIVAGDRVREYPQSHRAEAREAQENLALLRGSRTPCLIEGLEGADGGENVTGLGLVPTADLRWRRVRRGVDSE